MTTSKKSLVVFVYSTTTKKLGRDFIFSYTVTKLCNN